ncbi:conserved hypothetical protein [Coccidioides posadasii str. Silveira]|uniref:Uncharacterized protein n=2 Tax=Coccidioides posadasii TaxID=199306 RepID=E9DFE7_COCPS|nr:conserved hypothetical protein [Coccidioides posadasii str. Silveira]KMM70470.1 hypothetical protein CPAG_06782 [Coccidioides posadasii RMSCC 3488]
MGTMHGQGSGSPMNRGRPCLFYFRQESSQRFEVGSLNFVAGRFRTRQWRLGGFPAMVERQNCLLRPVGYPCVVGGEASSRRRTRCNDRYHGVLLGDLEVKRSIQTSARRESTPSPREICSSWLDWK